MPVRLEEGAGGLNGDELGDGQVGLEWAALEDVAREVLEDVGRRRRGPRVAGEEAPFELFPELVRGVARGEPRCPGWEAQSDVLRTSGGESGRYTRPWSSYLWRENFQNDVMFS